MTRYTVSHWGIYEIEGQQLAPLTSDPDPSPIGLHQIDPALDRARIRRPAIRRSWLEHGPGACPELRGKEPFVEVSWAKAIELLSSELKRVRTSYGNEAIFGGSYGWASAGRFHHAQSQVHRFLNSIGGYVRHTGSYSLGAAHVILPHVICDVNTLHSIHTTWDVMAEHTELFVTFGGVPAKNAQSSPGGAGHHRVGPGLRAMAEAGVRFLNIGPCDDNIDPVCRAEWLRCRPNSDTALMLALAWQLVRDDAHDRDFLDRCTTGFERFLSYLTGTSDGIPKTPEWAERITGVPAERIVALCREMQTSRTMLNIAWSLQRAQYGEQPFWMLITLAAMLGQVGLPGGGFAMGYGPMNTNGSSHRKLPGPTLSQGRNPVEAYIPCARISDMLLNPGKTFIHDGMERRYPDIRLVYWAGGNPYHHHQDLNRLNEAWQKPETIVIQDPYWTASAKRADIALPVSVATEREDIGYSSQEGFVVAMRKMRAPLGEARSDYAIFSDLAYAMGTEDEFTEGRSEQEWLEHMYGEMRSQWLKQGVDVPEFSNFWRDGLIDLSATACSRIMLEKYRGDPTSHPLPTPSGLLEIFSETIAGFGLPDCPGHPVWLEPDECLGRASDKELHLLTDQPANKLHSQMDPGRFSSKAKSRGRVILAMSPEDARQHGLNDGEVVELWNERGRCLAVLSVTDHIMNGVVRMPTGAWYDPDESGRDRHGNPNILTRDVGTSGLSQGCTAQSCLVRVRRAEDDLIEPNPFDPPEFSDLSDDEPHYFGADDRHGNIPDSAAQTRDS
ncbi:molybdopterin-dependent oxidoreductase [Paracoccus onubensis]|uniref:molybdopterin-dependent oxidoreductase n=1 Tax=Paracoccus onubensis TaxID=1675788 RepID=UPI00272FC7F5|nr:molybdopterin-dependent oxidoreductase [Paracoccus onubensis]MDP0929446.1 molybdopterin-dependent oxidoreductase [Paracoccus onubensis]